MRKGEVRRQKAEGAFVNHASVFQQDCSHEFRFVVMAKTNQRGFNPVLLPLLLEMEAGLKSSKLWFRARDLKVVAIPRANCAEVL